ncbi:MAG: T9SS type A sorting domain-containing protein [Candidatus Riflebacteria bacterium]|nr:T9SS type A sorting domain-containing protein [Candidatus Riflebacteria bacterium]
MRRQKNTYRFVISALRGLIAVLCLMIAAPTYLMADITGLKCTITDPAATTGNKYNAGVSVKLNGTWTAGDTPPFSATFLAGTDAAATPIGTTITNQLTADLVTTGSNLGSGIKSFKVQVYETAVPNAKMAEAVCDKNIEIDLTPPTVDVTLDNGSIFSPIASYNVVKFTVRSSKNVQGVPDVTVSPAIAGAAPAPDGTPTETTFRYTLALPTNVAQGQYTIRAVCKDTTLPVNTANQGIGQIGFLVQTQGPQQPTISVSDPVSPVQVKNFNIKGKINSSDIVAVALYDGGTKITDGTISGTDWVAGVTNASEGEHHYTVKGTDSHGNESPASPEFVVKVDVTPPGRASLTQPQTPTSASTITIAGTSAQDPVSNGVNSPPVMVTLFRMDGTSIASTSAASDGSFSFPSVALSDGENVLYAVTEDSANGPPGNRSNPSVPIRIFKDTSSSNVAAVLIGGSSLASQPLPLNASTWITAGNYSVEVDFTKDMDITQKPTVSFAPLNGGDQVSNAGSWTASRTFVAQIAIPSGQSATMDGMAQYLKITNAKDTAGNVMSAFTVSNSFQIDTTPPTSTMDSMDTIYVASGVNSINIKGSSRDSGSGVGYAEVSWQSYGGGSISSQSVPIFDGNNASWTLNWDVSGLAPGYYKLWAIAADRAKPNGNREAYNPTGFRTVMVDRDAPTVQRVSLDDLVVDINNMQPPSTIPTVASAVNKLTSAFSDLSGWGIDFNKTVFTLTHDQSNTKISGNFTNNGTDTMFFTFPQLTLNGTYTVSVNPFDKSGNSMSSPATRSFIIRTVGPSSVKFEPASGLYANDTNPAIATDQVWAFMDDPQADYSSSTMSVVYNGMECGTQLKGASTTALIWDLYGTTASHSKDQSNDGRYNITVVPWDIYGNRGNAQNSFFYYDSQAPVITQTTPASGSWCGRSTTTIPTQASDAPKDQVTFGKAAIAQDASWQNGLGSGLNLTTASYGAKLDFMNQSVSGSLVGTSTWNINLPNITVADALNSPGWGTITTQLFIADKVTSLAPNSATYTWTIFMDYLRPKMSFSKPLGTGKYCKNTLNLVGYATDLGQDATNLQVNRIEVSKNQGTYYPVNFSTGKEATWTYTMDISDLPNGTNKIYGRAFDRGGNQSNDDPFAATGLDSYVTFSIDRTPPTPPTPIIPLNDSIQNNRGERFKWNAVTGADKYLIQIADDSSFNNILNNLIQPTDATYTGLLGEITYLPESSFSVPKDGTFYWRVASIESCNDGYNISSFSTTMRFVIDTVKPKILEVQPSPSSGNKITTGMVTFSVRFSETMDTTIPPTVNLTSAGGQLMQLVQTSYKDNTWMGTTVIPRDSSALYDGNAILQVTNAKDLAGNQMESDSTNQVVIKTGPAFEIKIFSNPANPYEITIVTRSSEALQAPPTCTVSQGSGNVPVVMNFLKEQFYAGGYRIDSTQTGKSYIDISGSDLYGMTGQGSVEFVVQGVTTSSNIRWLSPDGLSEVLIGTGTVKKPASLFMLPRIVDDFEAPISTGKASIKLASVASGVSDLSKQELVEIKSLEEIGPSTTKISRKLRYTTDFQLPYGCTISSKYMGIYRNSGDGWVYCGGTVKGNRITSELDGLGSLALMADLKPPCLSSLWPSDGTHLDDALFTVEGNLNDKGSGIATESLQILIDGKVQTGVTFEADGTFKYAPKTILPKGNHALEIRASDRMGNQIQKSITFVAPGPFQIEDLKTYPNPTRGEAVWFSYNFGQKAEEIKLKVYDVSGHVVTSFDTFDFNSMTSGRLRWDLRNDNGRKVANGIYLYKLEAIKNGQKIKSSGKIAVLK